MFGNPKMIFKMLKTLGVKIRFDIENQCLVINQDGKEIKHQFEDIEKMVNNE